MFYEAPLRHVKGLPGFGRFVHRRRRRNPTYNKLERHAIEVELLTLTLLDCPRMAVMRGAGAVSLMA